jgi:hypothetical protein
LVKDLASSFPTLRSDLGEVIGFGEKVDVVFDDEDGVVRNSGQVGIF